MIGILNILVKIPYLAGKMVASWGAGNDHAAGVAAGSHLEMSKTGKDGIKLIVEAVKAGTLDEALLDQRVDEFLQVVFELCESANDRKGTTFFDVDDYHDSAGKVAKEYIVLLKNEENILLLKSNKKIDIIGDFAKETRYQCVGSSIVNPTKIDNVLEAWDKTHAKIIGYAQGFERNGKENKKSLLEVLELAEKIDAVLL